MASIVVSDALLLLLLVAPDLRCTLAKQQGCQSTFCFSFFSRKAEIDFNLFNHDGQIPIEDYIKKFGYPVETHDITTEDGYILTYHRIPYGKLDNRDSAQFRKNRNPVLLQHGLLGSSAVWVLEAQALGYALADAGFDVWLGNGRGNTYSRKHVKYNPDKDKKQFWDFSWHEMGYYDLPAAIDYILNKTQRDKLFYIGHSMGTTMYFVLGATRPEYMDKVEAMVAMAPVAFPWHIHSPLTKFFMRLHLILKWLGYIVGVYEVFPYSNTLYWLDQNICTRPNFQFICRDIMMYIGGFDDKELNRTSLPLILKYMPAGASLRQLSHFRQISSPGTPFRWYDHGFFGNIRHYGSLSPPSYNISLVTSPIYIHYATNDWLAVTEDVYHVNRSLPNVQQIRQVPDDHFNHLDFMWANDAKQLVYDNIIATLQKI